MIPANFARNVRSLNRLRHIAQVMTRHGFGYVVAQANLGRFVPLPALRAKAVRPPVEEGASAVGRRITQVFAELGPTFIKLGQLMSTRPDIVPPEVLKELRSLQDDVPPFESEVAMELIARELKRPVNECFASIGDQPIASASIGQVYRAELRGGRPVIVKVRRPGIEQTIRLDMQVLHWLATSLESFMPDLRVYRPVLLVSELDEMLTRELDYVNEASVTDRFSRVFGAEEGVRVPKVYWDLCGSSVLTLEALDGMNVDSLLGSPQGPGKRVDRHLVARRLANCYLRQIFELGVFHADPHPGNVLVSAPATVGLIDFGQVGTITSDMMTQLVIMVYASVNGEIDVAVDVLADLDALGSQTDRRHLERAMQTLLDKYFGLPMERWDIGMLTNEIVEVVRRHDVVVPRDLLMLGRTLSSVAGLTKRLDARFDLLDLLQPRIRRAMTRRLSPSQISRSTVVWGWHLFSLVRTAPVYLREFLRGLRTGAWQLHVQHENLDRLVRELDRSSNRIAFSVVIAAIIVGSSVVVSAATDLTLFGFRLQYLGIFGYVIAGVLGLALSWAIFRSGRLH